MRDDFFARKIDRDDLVLSVARVQDSDVLARGMHCDVDWEIPEHNLFARWPQPPQIRQAHGPTRSRARHIDRLRLASAIKRRTTPRNEGNSEKAQRYFHGFVLAVMPVKPPRCK